MGAVAVKAAAAAAVLVIPDGVASSHCAVEGVLAIIVLALVAATQSLLHRQGGARK